MPTALERTGDYSQSVNPNGSAILIRDPSTGAACTASGGPGCFAGNRVPASRISAIGAAFLNHFPLPNFNDPTGARQYNFQFQGTQTQPRQDKILRVDYNASSRDTLFVRLIQDSLKIPATAPSLARCRMTGASSRTVTTIRRLAAL